MSLVDTDKLQTFSNEIKSECDKNYASQDVFKADTKGLVPPPVTSNGKYLKDDGSWDTPEDTKYSVFSGATSTVDGKEGLVPKPVKGYSHNVLAGNGSFTNTGSLAPSFNSQDVEESNISSYDWYTYSGLSMQNGDTFGTLLTKISIMLRNLKVLKNKLTDYLVKKVTGEISSVYKYDREVNIKLEPQGGTATTNKARITFNVINQRTNSNTGVINTYEAHPYIDRYGFNGDTIGKHTGTINFDSYNNDSSNFITIDGLSLSNNSYTVPIGMDGSLVINTKSGLIESLNYNASSRNGLNMTIDYRGEDNNVYRMIFQNGILIEHYNK